jgi:hypothetical protein
MTQRLEALLQRPALPVEIYSKSFLDFGARRLLPQSARHQRERAPGTAPMLVPSLQRYQAYPLSKPEIDLFTPDFVAFRALLIDLTSN